MIGRDVWPQGRQYFLTLPESPNPPIEHPFKPKTHKANHNIPTKEKQPMFKKITAHFLIMSLSACGLSLPREKPEWTCKQVTHTEQKTGKLVAVEDVCTYRHKPQ